MAVVIYVGLLLTGLVFLAVFVVTDDRAYRREVERANAEGRGWKLVESPETVTTGTRQPDVTSGAHDG